jgi:hypothetical protein
VNANSPNSTRLADFLDVRSQQSTKMPPGGRKRQNVIIVQYQQLHMTSGATGVTHGPGFIAWNSRDEQKMNFFRFGDDDTFHGRRNEWSVRDAFALNSCR